ncbi:MAG: hypothetical protein HWE13_02270 [Gammaproteobacteria bacterium]|nr:hypothetical protein [Gammaproteobacteria bacterium]
MKDVTPKAEGYSWSAIFALVSIILLFPIQALGLGVWGILLPLLVSFVFSIVGWKDTKKAPPKKGKGLIITSWIIISLILVIGGLLFYLGYQAGKSYRVSYEAHSINNNDPQRVESALIV